jgi:hypothetical protein
METIFTIELSHAGLSTMQANIIRARYNDRNLQARSCTTTPVTVSHQNVSFGVRAENPEDAKILGARMWNKLALDAKRCGHGSWPFKGVSIKSHTEILLQEEWFL